MSAFRLQDKPISNCLVSAVVLRYSKARTIRKRGAVMWLLKLPFKLVAIVLMLVVGTIGVLLKIVSGISHVALGLIMFLLFVGGVITAFQGNWPLVGMVFVMEVICFAASRLRPFWWKWWMASSADCWSLSTPEAYNPIPEKLPADGLCHSIGGFLHNGRAVPHKMKTGELREGERICEPVRPSGLLFIGLKPEQGKGNWPVGQRMCMRILCSAPFAGWIAPQPERETCCRQCLISYRRTKRKRDERGSLLDFFDVK